MMTGEDDAQQAAAAAVAMHSPLPVGPVSYLTLNDVDHLLWRKMRMHQS
jgi:hypothetical protein